MSYQHGRADLVATVVAPAAAEAASTLLGQVRDSRERLTKYWARLKVVRQRRQAMQEALEVAGKGGTGGGRRG